MFDLDPALTGNVITATIAAVTTYLVARLTRRAEKQKNAAEAEHNVSAAWSQFYDKLMLEFTRLGERVKHLEEQGAESARREQQMLDDLRKIHAWAENGAPPPPPVRPPYLNR